MRVLITGINGFAGSHLSDHILANVPDVQLFGIDYNNDFSRISHIQDKINFRMVDICNEQAVRKTVKEICPDRIFHLAALIAVDKSFQFPQEFFKVNVLGTLYLLDAVRDFNPGCSLLVAGSSEEYGYVREDEVPIREYNSLRPMSPYAVSKVAAEKLVEQYVRSYKLHATTTRAFNHFGPRQRDEAAIANWVYQLEAISHDKTQEAVLQVGSLEAKRDLTDVRDIVRAYWMISERLRDTNDVGELIFNIATNKTKTMQEWLDLVFAGYEKFCARHKRSYRNIMVQPDPKRMRPSDVPILQGDYSKIHGFLGWEPQISPEQTIDDMFEWVAEHSKPLCITK